MIQEYQWTEPSIKSKYKDGTYQKGYFNGVSNIDIKLITCEDNIVITSKLQSYVLYWYHTYLLHTGMDRKEAISSQHFYLTNIRYDVLK